MHLNLFVTKCRNLKNVDGSDDVFVEVQFRGVTERTETVEDGGAAPGASCTCCAAPHSPATWPRGRLLVCVY